MATFEDKLVERFAATRDYSGKQPGKPTYDSIDVGEYLQDKAQSRRGLFLLRVRAVPAPRTTRRRRRRRRTRATTKTASEGESGETIEDTRLILVTDLGFIVKHAKDGSRDVFVQSIRSGLPVEGARVELIGSNGEPVLAATTDAPAGRSCRRSAASEKREKTPQLILVQKDDDLSFMPFRTGGRELDLSRFDTGGVESAESAQQVSTYLFSDRGIYRPARRRISA